MMDCNSIRQAAMAWADGETASLDASQVQTHFAACAECRRVVEELRSLNRLFDGRSRRVPAVDLWPRVRSSLAPQAASAGPFSRAAMFALLVTALLLLRAAVLTTGQASGWVARAVALLFVFGWWLLLRDNPFAVNPQLIQTKETRS